MSDQTNNALSENSLARIISHGIKTIIGGAGAGLTGATIGGVIGGPVGAALGGVGSAAVEQVLEAGSAEIIRRHFTNQQVARVGTMMGFAAQTIRWKCEAGAAFRQDDFFTDQPDDRSAYSEVVDAVIWAAQKEYAEKKLQLYGRLVANIAFHNDIDRYLAHQMITYVEQLSYRQLCFMSLLATHRNAISSSIRGAKLSKDDALPQAGIKLEIYDLIQRGLLHVSTNPQASFPPKYVEFHHLWPTRVGATFAGLTELKEIMLDDKLKLLKELPRHVG